MEGKKERGIRAGNRRLYFIGILILWLLVNIRILWGLMQLEGDAGIAALYYPGGITESGFDQWKENEESGLFSAAAAWKRDGRYGIVSEGTVRKQEAACYQVKGWPGAIFGNQLIRGRYFTEGEEGVCLLDRETVRQLFGAEDVSGLTVSLNGTDYRIVGILEENKPICVIPTEKETMFDGIAVQKKEKAQSFNRTVSLLEAAFGGTDGQRIDGQLYYVTGWLLYAEIMAAALILVGIGGKKRFGGRYILWICLAVSVGIVLTGVKIAAPGSDYLPSYWSDFDFFGRIFREKAEQIQELITHQEFDRWKRMLQIWRQVIGTEIISGVLTIIICSRIFFVDYKR